MTKKLELPKNSTMLSPNFTFGVATASFQIEGGAQSRLPCIWDTFCDTPGKIRDNSDGSVACDHLNRWEEDVELISSIGVDAYRFSVSWPRVVHQDGSPNDEGLDFYIKLLDALNAKGIKPYITLYHWDLPQHLEDNGGWLNRDTAFKFSEYTKILCEAFGDRVYSYATLNEPFCSSYLGYEIGIHAPGLKSKNYGKKAAHHLLLAHGLAMSVLKKHSPNTKNGIVLNFTPCYPASNSAEDIAATEIANQHFNQWYIKPIFDAQYPEIINQLPAEQCPDIVDGDMEIISQSIDFLGINFYTRAIYTAHPEETAPTDNYLEIKIPNVDRTAMGWEIYPQAFTDLLLDLNKRYKLPPIYITENGCAMDDVIENGEVNDQNRLAYYNAHINAVNNAIEQGVDVQGYFAWSLMDNFEWAEGYVKRFGIVYVDYETQKRTLKASGQAYQALIARK